MPTITPHYGATFKFDAIGSVYETNDGYVYGGNMGINNLAVSADILLPAQTDAEAKAAIDTIKSLSGTGVFQLQDPSNFYNDFYLNIDGYSLNYRLEDITDVTLKMSANFAAKAIRWTGCYLDDSFVSEWVSGASYARYDVVSYFSGLNYSGGGVVSGNATEMLFYCKEDVSGGTNPLSNTGSWTRYDLPLDLEIDTTNDYNSRSEQPQYRGAYKQKINFSLNNTFKFEPISVNWKNLSDKEAKCLIHFFENKQGYKRFNITGAPTQWEDFNVFVCSNWSHTINFLNSHDISATFAPDMRFKNQLYSGFSYNYTDLDARMINQWVPESGQQ